MGYADEQDFMLANETAVSPLNTDIAGFVRQALEQRPDLASLRLSRDASRRFAEAERKLRYPSITLLAAGGVIPEHDHTLHDNYAAAGVNVTLPFSTEACTPHGTPRLICAPSPLIKTYRI